MRMLFRPLGVSCFAVVFAVGASARADDALSDTARELFQKGVKAHEQKKWDQCRAAFLAAFAIKRHAQIAGNLADCELKLGMYRDAAEHLSIFLHERQDAPAERRASVEAALREASAKVATVRLNVDRSGAEVLVDGKQLGKAPLALPIFADPGPHTIEVRLDGWKTARETFDAKAGDARTVRLTLVKDEAPSVPAPERRSLVPGFVLGGGAVVAIATGAGLLAAGGAKRTNAENAAKGVVAAHHSCVAGAANFDSGCADIEGATRASDTLHNVGVGVLIGAGALAAATVTYFAWPAPRVSVVPVAGKSGAGLWISGSF